MPEATRVERQASLDTARTDHQAKPSLDTTIWLGRRTAYLGRYADAIAIYTQGLQEYGEQSRLLRHRGHRYITTRQFDRARSDLRRAAELIEGQPDAVEVDGLPNAAGVPTGTQHTNIYYHLGLAQFLSGDYAAARKSYEACLAASTTDDMRVATAHWLYMTLRRLGDEDAAAALLEPFHAELELYENFSYLRLVLLYKGEVETADLIPPDASDLDRATLGFGLGHWHLVSGDERRAMQVWRGVLETPQWAAFGYIAAEAEVYRRAS
jgi:tetratricopeptide (TPR) repeat protein